jgi:Holliday junction resolvase-like predicted endonuclease
MNYEPYNIGLAGEEAVANWLEQEGWKITRWNTQAPGSTDIEAQSGNKKLLVQVKSAVSPNKPSSLSWEEERNIKVK